MSETKVTIVNYPLEDSVTVKVGEKLRLNFTEDCHPCWDPDDAGLFDHHLPHGDQKKDDHWTGTAAKNGSIDCSYVPYGEKCSKTEGVKSSARSIKVGSD